MELLVDVKNNQYDTPIVTSEWALAELHQAVLDYRIAVKMIRDLRNPRFFQTQKQQYPLTEDEKRKFVLSVNAFILYLRKLGIEFKPFVPVPLTFGMISLFSVKYGVESPDALHLHLATYHHCKYLITVDEPLKNAEVKDIEVMYPSTFRSLPIHSRNRRDTVISTGDKIKH